MAKPNRGRKGKKPEPKKRKRVEVGRVQSLTPALFVPPVEDVSPDSDDVEIPHNASTVERFVHDGVVAAEFGTSHHVMGVVRRLIALGQNLEGLEANVLRRDFQNLLTPVQRLELLQFLSGKEVVLMTHLLNVLRVAEKYPQIKSMLLNIQPLKEVDTGDESALLDAIKANPALRRKILAELKLALKESITEGKTREAK